MYAQYTIIQCKWEMYIKIKLILRDQFNLNILLFFFDDDINNHWSHYRSDWSITTISGSLLTKVIYSWYNLKEGACCNSVVMALFIISPTNASISLKRSPYHSKNDEKAYRPAWTIYTWVEPRVKEHCAYFFTKTNNLKLSVSGYEI